MRTWQERGKLGKKGEHVRLLNPTQHELDLFCETNQYNVKLHCLTVAGNVRGYKIEDFTALARLPKLNELYVEDKLTQEKFEQVCHLTGLEQLHIYHGGAMTDLTPIEKLIKLQELTITTPTGWLSKLLYFPDILPIASLSNLEYLNLAGIAFTSQDISPLARLSHLKEVILIKRYDEQIEELRTTR